MAETFQFEIVTPEKLVASGEAEEMQIPAKNGYIGVLPQHAPLITELALGEISYRLGGKTERLAVAWGFAEVLPDRVTVLAETAERASDIDVERAQRSRDRAMQRIGHAHSDTDFERACASLKRAETRLEVAGKGGA